jgi:glycosyltransferase involved in cell wall biosynthesis
VIYPPVDTENFLISEDLGNYFITGGRLVPYKRFDLIIQTFNRLKYPLKIFGTGPEMEHLMRLAKPNIEFVGRVSDEQKAQLMSRALAFIHPQLEDAGVTPLESMASGRPVIAYGQGGATETIIPHETGIFFREQSWNSLLDAVLNFDANSWDGPAIREHAKKFDTNSFKQTIKQYVHDRHEEFQKNLNQQELFAPTY